MPPFYAHLAFVALNKLHTSTEAEIEAIVGPSLCHTLQQTSGLLFCCPISSPIQAGQRRAGVWPSKSHSPSCCTLAAWHGDNEVEGEEATAPRNRSGLCWRRGSEWNRAHTPKGAVCVHNSGQRLKRGQIAEEWVWNNSCLINQREAELQWSGVVRKQDGCLHAQFTLSIIIIIISSSSSDDDDNDDETEKVMMVALRCWYCFAVWLLINSWQSSAFLNVKSSLFMQHIITYIPLKASQSAKHTTPSNIKALRRKNSFSCICVVFMAYFILWVSNNHARDCVERRAQISLVYSGSVKKRKHLGMKVLLDHEIHKTCAMLYLSSLTWENTAGTLKNSTKWTPPLWTQTLLNRHMMWKGSENSENWSLRFKGTAYEGKGH